MFSFMEGCILDSRPDDKASSHDEKKKKHELITVVKQNDLNLVQEMVLKTWKVRIYKVEERETWVMLRVFAQENQPAQFEKNKQNMQVFQNGYRVAVCSETPICLWTSQPSH